MIDLLADMPSRSIAGLPTGAPVTNRYRAIGPDALDTLAQASSIPPELRFAIKVVSRVLPFRINQHVADTLIDWENLDDDPMARLVLPSRDMLRPDDFARVAELLTASAPSEDIKDAARRIRATLNPHPSGQREHNVPMVDGVPFAGLQHKYRETVLFFPARGQTCHAYCTFCFRWAQFVGDRALKFASKEAGRLATYLGSHRDVSDLLITGGDPMIMATQNLRALIEPLFGHGLDHVQSIRIGTKSLTFWPQRFVTDPDADDLLRLIERTVKRGRQVAIMAHINHWREIDNPMAHTAIQRLRDAGASIRSQAPLLARVNDDPATWARNWREQVRLGIHPYYMFVERDTGPRNVFEVPLRRCLEVYRGAVEQVSGLARSARGPVMSATPGKVEVLDVVPSEGGARFLLQFLQSRDPSQIRRPFLAEGDPSAVWYDQLTPYLDDTPAFADPNLDSTNTGLNGHPALTSVLA